MLVIAVMGYVFASWAWALMAPLAPLLDDTLGLTPMPQALAVALPGWWARWGACRSAR